MNRCVWAAAAAITLCTTAQAGPVYKCTVNGKTGYSDAPCVGATEVDVTPTEGMNKWTGAEQKSLDQVQREMTKKRRDALSKSLAPMATITTADFEREEKRASLPTNAKHECKSLDAELGELKRGKPVNEQALYAARARFFKLKC